MMTRKAHELGMSSTLYRNASGLPNDEQVTTAHDLTILGRALQERFPRYFHYFSTAEFDYAGESSAITTICSAASTASTASRPATRARPASIS